jgi:GTP-binding protein HflX
MTDRTDCILIALDDNVIELKDLAESMGYSINEIFIQYRDKPDTRYFIGKGKVKEVEDYIKENDIQIVIVNATLKPSQQYNLENLLKITIFDRLRLILEIFADRAHSEEARLQVEHAKLQYEAPLLRDWIHKARYSEKPGFMAGGEYEVAQYYEISRKRIKKIKQKLTKIEKEREIRRKQRRSKGYYLVGIVGYTNAGKSTLFNMISGESVSVENRLFTTLSTTTRKIPKVKKPIILTDTVGLINNLPHWMIGSFHSTLEEMFLSDLILLMVDASEKVDEVNRKLKTSFDVLLPDIEPSKILLILNKIDMIKTNQENEIQNIIKQINLDYKLKDIIPISAQDQKYKDILILKIQEIFEYSNALFFKVPNTSQTQSFINWIHENCDIVSIRYENSIYLDIRYKLKDKSFLQGNIKSLEGSILNEKTDKPSSK